MVHPLESRQLLTVSLTNGELRIVGTAGADVFDVTPAFDVVTVTLNQRETSYPQSDVHRVRIFCGNGDDAGSVGNFFGEQTWDAPVTIYGGAGDENIQIIDLKTSRVYGEAGNDRIYSQVHASDTFYGGAGNDSLSASLGHDVVFGDDGNDDITGGSGSDVLSGGAGDDQINGGLSDPLPLDNDFIDGGPGNDNLAGRFGNDTILGSSGDDSIFGGDGNDRIDGGTGIDSVDAGRGSDRIFARDNEVDVLIGGAGRDTVQADSTDLLTTIERRID
jgi:Ca2+-binding RTX toxin-like protein